MKQPVYIRSDFDNVHVELTSEQVKRLIEFADKLAKENERRLFATTTNAGTAMAETAVCSEHNTEMWQKILVSGVSESDGSDFVFYDCTGNDVLSCQVCGWPEAGEDGT